MTDPYWPPPFHNHVEVTALSLWLDGKHDEARQALSVFTGIGVAEFLRKLNGFHGAVANTYQAKLDELTEV